MRMIVPHAVVTIPVESHTQVNASTDGSKLETR